MEKVQGVKSIAGSRVLLKEEECSYFLEKPGEKRMLTVTENDVVMEFHSQSRNESFARMVTAAFVSRLNPTLEEIADIKTAVSEAVTNAIIHGYSGREGIIQMRLAIEEDEVTIEVADQGIGMEDVLKAMEPMYTTRPELERSGMGFAFMEAFMDELEVQTKLGIGTLIRMKKRIAAAKSPDQAAM